ncbi:MAG: hypothetical protein HC828_20825, partial [Blastochloris sp.]|nr:hypothetical protein [Blastochloris sp.]
MDQPAPSPTWTTRISGALALLARDGRPPHQHDAAVLLPQLMPALAEAFDALHNAGMSAPILQLLKLLPPGLACTHAERLAYRAATAPELAWELAEMLTAHPALPQPVDAPLEPSGLARWAYVQALGDSAQRTRLFHAGGKQALEALATSPAGEARRIRAASAIISDTDLPSTMRITGLELLSDNSNTAALAVIERACYDPALEIRQAALTTLVNNDSTDAHTSLSRTALNRNVPWNTRLDAIRRL